MVPTLAEALEEWEKQLKRDIKEVKENQETDENFSKGYFQGMEMAYEKTLIKLQGIQNGFYRRD